MYGSDAFNLSGSGHLSASERALKHEVLSGSSCAGGGYSRKNSTTKDGKSSYNGFAPRQSESPIPTAIFVAVLAILSVASTVIVLGPLYTIDAAFSSVGGFLGWLIIAGPLHILFIGWDIVVFYGIYAGIRNVIKEELKNTRKKSRKRGSFLKTLTYVNFILALDVLLIAGTILLVGKVKTEIANAKIRAEEAKEQAAIDERIAEGRCVYSFCEKSAIPDSTYCRMHTCGAEGCSNYVEAFDRCELHKAGYVETSPFALAECVVNGCNQIKDTGSPYCIFHRPSASFGIPETEADTTPVATSVATDTQPASTTNHYERTIDDQDVDSYYEDYRDEFEDIDDAWDDLEDNEDEWDDY